MREVRYKPIFVMQEPGVSSGYVRVVLEGIDEILGLARVEPKMIPVRDLGVWRESDWRIGNQTVPERSVDWYIEQGRAGSIKSGQLNTWPMIMCMSVNPLRFGQRHYEVLILNSDIYFQDIDFIIGHAMRAVLALGSTFRFSQLTQKESEECIKSEMMHELGHMFGLPDTNRQDGSLEDSLGIHCTNTCVMRQGLAIPNDFQRITQDRLHHGPFCSACLRELREFFASDGLRM